MRRSVQWGIAGLVLALSLIAPLVVAARAQGAVHRAGLVVRFSDDHVVTRCVEFTEESITGEELLRRAGLRIVSEYNPGLGAAICQIEGVGCNYPAVPCFCQCQGAECVYWAYYYLANGQWVYSGFGVSNRQVRDGDVEGWSWGPGSTSGATAPPIYSLDQICAPPATATPAPTNTPEPTATFTPWPTATRTPAPTRASQVQFWADAPRLTAGECATLRWDVEYATAVYLDGQGVTGHEARSVCPPQTHTYELRVVAGGQETTYRVTIEVTPAADTPVSPSAPATTARPSATPRPPSPTAAPTATLPPPTPTPAPAARYTASPTPTPSPTPRRVAEAVPPPPTSAPQPPAAPSDVAFTPPATGGSPADLALFGLTTLALAGVGAFALWRRR